VEEEAYTQQIMIGYLLGLLPRSEQERFEADLLADDRLLEELGAVEDELIDDYLSDQLSQPYRDGFESHFLRSLEHQRRLTFAMSFKSYIAKSQPAVSSDIQARTLGWWRSLISFLRK
jgi:anti-sigma factor RsiW